VHTKPAECQTLYTKNTLCQTAHRTVCIHLRTLRQSTADNTTQYTSIMLAGSTLKVSEVHHGHHPEPNSSSPSQRFTRSSKGALTTKFPHQKSVYIQSLPHTSHIPIPLHRSTIHNPNNTK